MQILSPTRLLSWKLWVRLSDCALRSSYQSLRTPGTRNMEGTLQSLQRCGPARMCLLKQVFLARLRVLAGTTGEQVLRRPSACPQHMPPEKSVATILLPQVLTLPRATGLTTQQTARALSSNSLHLRSPQVSLSCLMASCLGTLPKAQVLLLALSFPPPSLWGPGSLQPLSRLPTTDPSGRPNSTWFLLTHQPPCPSAWLLWGTPAFPAPSHPSCCLTGSADSPFISVLPKGWHRFPQRAGPEAMNSNCCHPQHTHYG